MPARLRDDEVERRLAAKHFTLLSRYKGNDKPVKVRCPLCGKHFSTTPKLIFRGGVKSCGCARRGSRRIPPALGVQRLEAFGFEVLGEYVDTKTPVLLKCPYCGTPFWTKPNSIFSRTTNSCGCYQRRRASECRKLPDDEVKRRLAVEGFTLLSDYKGCEKPIRVGCPLCGKPFWAIPKCIFRGGTKRCRSCTRKMTRQRLRKDIAGERHGLLVALYPIETKGKGQVVWMVRCDCGKKRRLTVNQFRRYGSCGCRMNRTGEDNPRWTGIGRMSGQFWAGFLCQAHRERKTVAVDQTYCSRKFRQAGRDLRT